jgi:RecB family endonuclease NucS
MPVLLARQEAWDSRGGGAPGPFAEACAPFFPPDYFDTVADPAAVHEHDLQQSLRRSIAQLEPGLTIIDGNSEQTVASGRINITARDRAGSIVVVELKDRKADGEAIALLLAHMGDLMTDEAPVRGVLVARDFTPCAIAAARAVPNLRLVQYGFRFIFEPVPLSAF